MRFKLKDGNIIKATKDCDCNLHGGPHWLHLNDWWKQENEKFLDEDTLLSLILYMSEENARLREKQEEMEMRNIIAIIRDKI